MSSRALVIDEPLAYKDVPNVVPSFSIPNIGAGTGKHGPAPVAVIPPPVRYVAGFAFDETGTRVVLIRKAKPNWMRGLLNGVGGKIENGETPRDAMVREFLEEAGVETQASDWREFCRTTGPGFVLHWFCCFSDTIIESAHTCEEEEVGLYEAWTVTTTRFSTSIGVDVKTPESCIPNLRYLIPMALGGGAKNEYITIDERRAN